MIDENSIPEATTAESASIKAINKDTVHKICSGQVVLSLAVAVKELVENAVDASATLVEIKLRNQGLESVEVSDNGSGVEEQYLEAMTAKYHTSKIKEFVDLKFVETFGFRGEALSSLCALADVTISTRHKSSDVGIRIELDHDGKIKKRSPCAHNIGTSVMLQNLFATLPVRRRDFTRNIKKEFTRMCHMLQAYCLVSKGVRIICTNHTQKSGKTMVMQTQGSQEILSNISSVFGSRQTTDLISLKSPFDDEELTEESLIAELQEDVSEKLEITSEDVERLKASLFQFEGYLSSCSHGAGRSAKDRQYFYINSRPCDLKNVSKLINDVYHRYNVNQYPFIYLNILTATRSDVDVNLTPDKRQVLINNEKILLLAVKKSLIKTFGNIPSTYKLQNSSMLSIFKTEAKNENLDETTPPNENTDEISDYDDIPVTSTQRYVQALSQWKRTGDTDGPMLPIPAKRKCPDEITVHTTKLKKIHEFLVREGAAEKDQRLGSYKSESETDEETAEKSTIDGDQSIGDIKEKDISADISNRIDCKVLDAIKTRKIYTILPSDKINGVLSELDSPPLTQESLPLTQEYPSQTQESFTNVTIELDESDPEDVDGSYDNYVGGAICTSLAELELNAQAEENCIKANYSKTKLDRLRFKSEINPSKNNNAEAELEKEISKECFAKMEIIGQFNLGFIIVKLDMDLFIVDQHATDEKYNFEMLQRTTVLQYQPLAVPLPLELTAVNEMVLLDHLEVFEKNGFKFQIIKNAPPTRKVVLLGKPISRNWDFGKGDIDELIFMLQDATEGTVCRPSRIRDMLASRACRKSVMIGKALNKSTMKTLIRHMGEIEHPWNCPHGRPTMRHLINISLLSDEIDKVHGSQ